MTVHQDTHTGESSESRNVAIGFLESFVFTNVFIVIGKFLTIAPEIFLITVNIDYYDYYYELPHHKSSSDILQNSSVHTSIFKKYINTCVI